MTDEERADAMAQEDWDVSDLDVFVDEDEITREYDEDDDDEPTGQYLVDFQPV
jgi:hypothetical protein